MVIDERECRKETVAEVARQIMIAGRTAPKGKGIDLIEIVAVTGETIEALAEATRLASEQTGMKFFLRDAENIRRADAVILVGTRLQSLSLNCGYCGYPTCEKKNGHPARSRCGRSSRLRAALSTVPSGPPTTRRSGRSS